MPAETPKQAACLNCRKSKIRCDRDHGGDTCRRCEQLEVDCKIPEFHIGRQRGVKNKRKGLEKAIFQIEQAIKKSKDSPESNGASHELQRLVDDARTSVPINYTDRADVPDLPGMSSSGDEQLALDDAENPLNLLARASDLKLAAPQASEQAQSSDSNAAPVARHDDRPEKSDVHRFFLPTVARYDTGSENGIDTDPIALGLATVDEALSLVTFFHETLAHTRWGLDPLVHNLEFMRAHSAFLLTSVLGASALFIDAAAPLATRLANHRNFLSQRVIAKRFRSVEIVLAFMVNIPWMQAGEHAADDDTGFFISTALSIAMDLSLNKIIIPSTDFGDDLLKRIAKADCIDARKALAMDGFPEVAPTSELGQRLLRRRERAWIALFVLERGYKSQFQCFDHAKFNSVCLARGRSYCMPSTPLTNNCDKWHLYRSDGPRDGPMISMTVLRRDLDALFSTVRARCDSYRVIDVGTQVAEEIESTIDLFFEKWLTTWTTAIGEGKKMQLPPYVEIMVAHTRLSTYSGVMNHPTAPLEVKRLFRTAGLSSALNVMRAAIQGESRLRSMPNNTAIMISFAACVALNLSIPSSPGATVLAPSVRSLVEEAADVLERVGKITLHRNGMSILYANCLRELVKNASEMPPRDMSRADASDSNMLAPQLLTNENIDMTLTAPSQYQDASDWEQLLQFSAMSDNEIYETILKTGNNFDTFLPEMSMNETDGMIGEYWMSMPQFGLGYP